MCRERLVVTMAGKSKTFILAYSGHIGVSRGVPRGTASPEGYFQSPPPPQKVIVCSHSVQVAPVKGKGPLLSPQNFLAIIMLGKCSTPSDLHGTSFTENERKMFRKSGASKFQISQRLDFKRN